MGKDGSGRGAEKSGVAPFLRSFGRRRSRSLAPALKVLMEGSAPLFIKPEELKLVGETWLEIGFGGGEHLASQAARHPEINFIGCEPFLNGVAKLVRQITKLRLENIGIFQDDARELLAALPPGGVSRVFILFPDPWPKNRHHKRRLISDETLSMLSRVMKPGAELFIATDDDSYKEWILACLLKSPDFQWTAKKRSDWENPFPGHSQTRYEAKALKAGRKPVYLRVARRAEGR